MSAAAATSAASASASVSAPASPSGSDIETLVTENRFTQLQELAQQKELEEGGIYTRDSELWYCIQLFTAALTDNVLTSKWVWKRIPDEMKKRNKDIQTIWMLLCHLHRLDYAAFFHTHSTLSAASSYSNPILHSLHRALGDYIRRRNLAAIQSAYSSVSLETVMELSGWKANEVEEWANKEGLTAVTATTPAQTQQQQQSSSSTRFFAFAPQHPEKDRHVEPEQIKQLTNYIMQLEQ